MNDISSMEAIEFINNYNLYLLEIKEVIKPEFHPIIDDFSKIDPHDLVRPETFFTSESEAKGLVWSLFIKRARIFSQPNYN